jgi:hypothetical protein
MVPGLVVVASFSAEAGRPTVVIQATMGSGNVASGENRASALVVADDDDIFGCRFLPEVIVIRLGLLRGKP